MYTSLPEIKPGLPKLVAPWSPAPAKPRAFLPVPGPYIKTPEQWRKWLSTARPGSACCYWQGRLGVAREGAIYSKSANMAWVICRQAEVMGALAWTAYSERRVYLTQRKHPLLGFIYIATKANPGGVRR